MDELTLLANALMALDDKLAACMKCGMCQSVCPVFGETMMEADVTRGKLTLLENLAQKHWDREFDDQPPRAALRHIQRISAHSASFPSA